MAIHQGPDGLAAGISKRRFMLCCGCESKSFQVNLMAM
jgi:hypothetical protein